MVEVDLTPGRRAPELVVLPLGLHFLNFYITKQYAHVHRHGRPCVDTANNSFTEQYSPILTSEREMHFGLFISLIEMPVVSH